MTHGRDVIVDWEQFERLWFEVVTGAIVATAVSNPTERFYAGAFWMLHGDGSSLHPPVFGLNSESSDPDIRWHPPDWRWSIIDQAHEHLQPSYRPLLALQVDEATYETLWDQHVEVLARTSRRVTRLVRSNQLIVDSFAFTPGFFVGIIDFAQGIEAVDYLRRSVDEQTIAASGILDHET